MHRNFIFALAVLLVAVAPIWSYSRHWTFGPFIAVLFLLCVNLTVYLFARNDAADLPRPSAKS
ncbi:MAG TPA: hypothetical protein VN723_04875 [Rhizomicrobium sp.]|jgi:hypothetical protein|nr:hypothetical protein [Rhizomicrobium sp.]